MEVIQTTTGNQTQVNPRVAIVYQLDRKGGVQSCVLALVRGLNRQGIVPDILWDRSPDWDMLNEGRAEARYRPIPFRVPTRWIERTPNSLRYLLKVANTIDGDEIRADYDFFFVFYNGFLLSNQVPHVRYLSGPPLIPQLNHVSKGIKGAPMRTFQWMYRNWLRRNYPVYEFHRTSRYVINSQFTAALFQEAHGEILPVIHPPIVIPERTWEPDDWTGRDTVTYFSRILRDKRPEMILELAQHHPDLRFVIMGGVPQHRQSYFEDLQQQAASQGLQHITFLANPSNERVQAELARTRFYVFPARNEHFGMTTVEAIAAGAIPYVHDSGGQREIVPLERLRFEDPEFVERFQQLRNLPTIEANHLRAELYAHIGQFSEDVFVSKMLAFMKQEV